MHAKFLLLGMKVRWEADGERILLGDNTGSEEIMLQLLRVQCVQSLSFIWTPLYIQTADTCIFNTGLYKLWLVITANEWGTYLVMHKVYHNNPPANKWKCDTQTHEQVACAVIYTHVCMKKSQYSQPLGLKFKPEIYQKQPLYWNIWCILCHATQRTAKF
jgi:hypothetical protein